ncbi:MAG TPA: hypothetical protein VGM76_06925 [Lacipirellulaceae bacterium]|jgi:hypothetical protein
MLSGVWHQIVFLSYVAALGLELLGPKRRLAGVRAALVALMVVGIAAQAIELTRHAILVDSPPLASPAEWLYMAAVVLAAAYLAAIFYLPTTPIGVLALPLVLCLVVAAGHASQEPFSPSRTSLVWGSIHGVALLLGTVAVCVGFWAGLMYLVQSYALKHPRSSSTGFRLPSLEWLERVNSRALGLSTLLIAVGCGSGVVLSLTSHRDNADHSIWRDPVVISSAAMMIWLFAAELFRWLYPAARQGRKVAYLTLASFVFLAATVASLTLVDTSHGRASTSSATAPSSEAASS